MILTCPECSTNYLTKAKAIGPNGRTVRCAKCENTWFVSTEEALEVSAQMTADERALDDDLKSDLVEDTPADVAPVTPVPDNSSGKGAHVTIRDKADAEKLARRRKVIIAIWAIPLAILCVAAILAYVFRQDIVNRIPETATIYKSFGMTVKTAGLEIENPTARTAMIDGQTVLVVNSAIKNLSSETLAIPMIELSLHNNSGDQLAQWYVEPEQRRLKSKSRLEFATEYPDPPVDAVDLRYDFADRSKI